LTADANHTVLSVVVFRVDASLQIGTGHVMRCLTLADGLALHGAECHFVCREHCGHMIDVIEQKGFFTHHLPLLHPSRSSEDDTSLNHAHWLGASWEEDAAACASLVGSLKPDWLVVDHYALDTRWEAAVLPSHARLLVIDDLADRPHRANLLLDQNLGRVAEDYAPMVPESCQMLIGPQFALLRAEFAELRAYSLERRRQLPRLKRLLISLGGVDEDNVTGAVLDALAACDQLPEDLEVTVVMGTNAPWIDDVKARAETLPRPVEVVVDISDMARRMADSDLAIGAAGSSAWERCCVGLPTLMLALADNQKPIAEALYIAGAGKYLQGRESIIDELCPQLEALQSSEALQTMALAAARQTTGEGVVKLFDAMRQKQSLA
jgi:UDP-2,4-diacetamido-2,4,6-trideoxy-beta-L-altropyranose hydrolase